MKLATLCYVRQSGRTLMIHRVGRPDDIHLGKWNGLGGKFEAGESPEQCVTREVLEESGLRIQQPHYHGLLLFAGFKGDDWYVWLFSAEQFTGEMVNSSVEGHLQWIPDEELTSLNLWPSDLIFLPWLKTGKVFSARFQYTGDEMLGHEVAFY